MKTKTVPTTLGALPAVRLELVSQACARDAALRLVDGVLARPEAGRAPLSALEWAAVKHLAERARRVNQIPGISRLGFEVELSPWLKSLLGQ